MRRYYESLIDDEEINYLLQWSIIMITTFPIYFSDLNEDVQVRLLELLHAEGPEDMNFDMDIVPIAVYDFEEDLSR